MSRRTLLGMIALAPMAMLGFRPRETVSVRVYNLNTGKWKHERMEWLSDPQDGIVSAIRPVGARRIGTYLDSEAGTAVAIWSAK